MSLRSGLFAATGLLVFLTVAFFLYASHQHRAVLFYYGAAPEVPQGRSFAIMNPFRDRTSERTAERLIHDLKTSECQKILAQYNAEPDICPTVQGADRVSLSWREDGDSKRVLVYKLVGKREAKLWVLLVREEGGFGVQGISMVR